jgi:hypothetical protein
MKTTLLLIMALATFSLQSCSMPALEHHDGIDIPGGPTGWPGGGVWR